MIAIFLKGLYNSFHGFRTDFLTRMVVYYPIFFLRALWHRASIKFYHVKWFSKINLVSLYCPCLTVISYYANPFLRIV